MISLGRCSVRVLPKHCSWCSRGKSLLRGKLSRVGEDAKLLVGVEGKNSQAAAQQNFTPIPTQSRRRASRERAASLSAAVQKPLFSSPSSIFLFHHNITQHNSVRITHLLLFVCSIAPSGCTTSSSTSSSLSTPLSSQHRFSQHEALYCTFSSSIFHPSIIHLHRVTHSLTIMQLFRISAIIAGAVAVTDNSSSVSCAPTSATLTVVSKLPYNSDFHLPPGLPITALDQVHISFGVGEHCSVTTFDSEHYLTWNQCYSQDSIKNLRTRAVMGRGSIMDEENEVRCVLAIFSDLNCSSDGTIVQNLKFPKPDYPYDHHDTDQEINHQVPCIEANITHGLERVPARSVKWTCADFVRANWTDLTDPDDRDDLVISARSVDAENDKDHVTVTPADNLNCNSAQHRDTDTKLQGHCHPFDKPFFSLRADVKRSEDHSVIGGSEPCSVLVFSDKKCRRDGASIVDLNNTPTLGVCHNVTLHHGKNDAAIAGHSWKWVCGRQNIEDCLKPVHHSKAHHSEAPSTVIGSATTTVTATTSLACSMTTEFAHYLDVLTSVVTLKPVTHTSTSVFTKTKTHVRTKLITSVATEVSTVHHSVTKPYTTTYMVCDVKDGSQV